MPRHLANSVHVFATIPTLTAFQLKILRASPSLSPILIDLIAFREYKSFNLTTFSSNLYAPKKGGSYGKDTQG
jgi:hypothetical protein